MHLVPVRCYCGTAYAGAATVGVDGVGATVDRAVGLADLRSAVSRFGQGPAGWGQRGRA